MVLQLQCLTAIDLERVTTQTAKFFSTYSIFTLADDHKGLFPLVKYAKKQQSANILKIAIWSPLFLACQVRIVPLMPASYNNTLKSLAGDKLLILSSFTSFTIEECESSFLCNWI